MATKEPKQPLKIVSLVVKNMMRVVAIEIAPDGDVITISGANEMGKSSVVNSIWIALGGDDAVPDMPIRKGETEGFIELDLGEYIVRKVFRLREDGSLAKPVLSVRGVDGHKLSSPQTLIKGLLGKYTFDPLVFDRMKPLEQFEALKGHVPGVDFNAIAKAHDDDFKARTDINRDAKALQAQIEAILIPDDAPTEKVDEAALVDEIASVGDHNADIEDRKRRRDAAREKIDEHHTAATAKRKEAEEFRRMADQAEEDAKKQDADADALIKRLAEAPELPAPKDAAEVRARLSAAQAVNALVSRRAQRKALEERHAEFVAKSEALTAAMEKRQADKLKKISEAKLPVEGLEFGDGILLLNGIPLSQCSSAQRLRTSIAIAMAENPRLRVLRTEVSMLDRNGMKILAEMAKERGYQVWAERVDDSGTGDFVIEDGQLRGATPPADDSQAEAA